MPIRLAYFDNIPYREYPRRPSLSMNESSYPTGGAIHYLGVQRIPAVAECTGLVESGTSCVSRVSVINEYVHPRLGGVLTTAESGAYPP